MAVEFNPIRNLTETIWQACSLPQELSPTVRRTIACGLACIGAIIFLYERSQRKLWEKERAAKQPLPQTQSVNSKDSDRKSRDVAASSLSSGHYNRKLQEKLPDNSADVKSDGSSEKDEHSFQSGTPTTAEKAHSGVIDSDVIGKAAAAEQKQASPVRGEAASGEKPIRVLTPREIIKYNRRLLTPAQVERKLQDAFSRAQEDNDMVPEEAKGKWGKISYEAFPERLDHLRPGILSQDALKINKRDVLLRRGQMGIASMKGAREFMEDRESVYLFPLVKDGNSLPVSLYGLFDGHNGSQCAEFFAEKIQLYAKQALEKEVTFDGGVEERTGIYNALTRLFIPMTKGFLGGRKAHRHTSHSTAIAVLYIRERLWVANAGDSRAIVVDNQKTVALSSDSRPKNCERAIRKRIGWLAYRDDVLPVTSGPLWKSWGCDGIPMGRAVGYPEVGSGINPRTEVIEYVPQAFEGPRFLVMCCDGVWGELSSNQVGEIVREHQKKLPSEIAEIIIKQAYCQNSFDNLTAIVIPLTKVAQEHNDADGGVQQSTALVQKQ